MRTNKADNFNRNITIDLNKHFHQLQIDLKHWSSTPDDLLTGISVIFPDFPPAKDVVYQASRCVQ
jgi:hypothetical protein